MVDPATWLVTLRPGVRFWSGRAMDAAVVASLERSRALAPAAAALLQGVRIEPLNDGTIRFQADNPLPGLPLNLANEWLVIHNAQSYGPTTNSFDVGAADLTGFYRIASFEPGERLLLTRNEQYWGVQPRMRRLRFEQIVDTDARALAALSGEAHSVRVIGSAVARQIERSRTMRTRLGYQRQHRHAVSQHPTRAVQRRSGAAGALLGNRSRRDGAVGTRRQGHAVPLLAGGASCVPRGEKGRLHQAGRGQSNATVGRGGLAHTAGGRTRVKDGAPLKFRVYWFNLNKPQAEILQAQWAKIGVEVDVQGTSDASFSNTRRAAGDWDAIIEQWNTVGDPAAVLTRHTGAAGALNYSKFSDPEIESLLAGFANIFDADARHEQALKVNRRHAEVLPFIPLTSQDRLGAVSRRVRNYTPHFTAWIYEVTPDTWVATA